MKKILQIIMLRQGWGHVKKLNRIYPLTTSCITYGSLMGLAELSQQVLEKKVIPKWKKQKTEALNLVSVARLEFFHKFGIT